MPEHIPPQEAATGVDYSPVVQGLPLPPTSKTIGAPPKEPHTPAITRSSRLSYNVGVPSGETIREVASLFGDTPYEGAASLYDTVFYAGRQYTRYDAIKWGMRLLSTAGCRYADAVSLLHPLDACREDVQERCERSTRDLLMSCAGGLKARIRYQHHGQFAVHANGGVPPWLHNDTAHYAHPPLLGPETEVVITPQGRMAFPLDDVQAAARVGSERYGWPCREHIETTPDGTEIVLWPWWLVDFDHQLGDDGKGVAPEVRRAWLRLCASDNLARRIAQWNNNDGRRAYDPHRRTLTAHMFRSRQGGLNEALTWARSHKKEWPRAYVLEVLSTSSALPPRLEEELNFLRLARGKEAGSIHLEYYTRVDAMCRRAAGQPTHPDYDSPWDRNRTCQGMPWASEWWWCAPTNPLRMLHSPDTATDPMQLSYWQSIDKFHRGVRTTIKPGKYLKKYFGLKSKDALFPTLSDADIQKWAEAWEREFKPVPVHFKEDNDPDGWMWVYSNETGFSSCMSAYQHSGRGPAAVRVYAKTGNGLRLAYTTTDGQPYSPVTARCIVRDGPDGKGRARTYGDGRLAPALGMAGYEEQARLLDGVELALIECDEDHWYLPYIDRGTASGGGSMYVRLSADKTALIATLDYVDGERQQANRYETALIPKHYLDGTHQVSHRDAIVHEDDDEDEDDDGGQCDVCSTAWRLEELEYSSFHGEYICPDCIDNYCYAYTGLYEHTWVFYDRVVEYDGEYYFDSPNVLEAHDLARCDFDGEVCLDDELVEVPSGNRVNVAHATALNQPHVDGTGGEFWWCMDEDAVVLHDGTTVYMEDAIEWADGSRHHIADPEPEQDEATAEEQAA
jgi:hypothetical protein